MPGITLVHDGTGRARRDEVLAAVRAAAPLGTDDTWLLHGGTRLLVVATAYPGYPIAVEEDDDVRAILEGRIYHAAAGRHERDLLRLARALLRGADPDATAARWLAGLDGEFVLVAVDRATDAAVVLVDRYGRLPFHHGTAGECTAASRDARVAAALLGRPALSRTAISHYLLFGHPLGTSTLFEAVRRMPPAGRIALPDGGCRPLLRQDLEASASAGRDVDLAPALAEGLVEACRRRAPSDAPAVISLSGGIDSRLVAGALVAAGRRPLAVTHVDVAGDDTDEAEAAGEVARALGIPWQPIAAPPPTGDAVARLLRLKAGANYLGMSRVLPFLDAVAARHGQEITFFTGDLGDRVLGPIAPPVPLRSAADVAGYLLRREAILSLDAVAAATGLRPQAVYDDLVARIESYPERQGPLRLLRFMLGERGFRWAFEGEDRNRCWFWSTTPFFAPDVFECAMAAHPAAKALHRLRVRTLERLSPRLAAIVDVTTRARVTSPAFRMRLRLRRLGRAAAYRLLRGVNEERVRRLVGSAPGHAPGSPAVALVRAQLAHPVVGAYLDPTAVGRILDAARAVPREQFSVLYTVTSLIQAVDPQVVAPALEAFRELHFV